MSVLLPSDFSMLEPFAGHWAGATARDRAALRDGASVEEARAFHAAVQPVLEPALAYLDARPLSDLDEKEARLMRLLLSFAHVAMAVEVQREDEPKHARLRPHMRLTIAPADRI